MNLYDFVKDGKLDLDAIEELKTELEYKEEKQDTEVRIVFDKKLSLITNYENGEVSSYFLKDDERKIAVFNENKILYFVNDYRTKEKWKYNDEGKSLRYVEKENGDMWFYQEDCNTLKQIMFSNGGYVSFYEDGKAVKFYKENKDADLKYFGRFQGEILASVGVEEIDKVYPLVEQLPNLYFKSNKEKRVNEMSSDIDENSLAPVPEGYKSIYLPRYVKDEDLPKALLYLRTNIKRKIIDYFVEFDEEKGIYKFVDKDGKVIRGATGSAGIARISCNEERFILKEKDYEKVRQIELEVKKAVDKVEGVEKVKAQFDVLDKYDRPLSVLYLYIFVDRSDLNNTLYHEAKHIVDGVVCGYRAYCGDYKKPTAEEEYKLNVEEERVAYLEELNKAIKEYFTNGNKLYLSFRSSLVWIADRFCDCSKEEIRKKLYPPVDIMKEALQRWNDEKLEIYFDQFQRRCLASSGKSLFVEEDTTGEEYKKQRSLLYSFEVYNPNTKKMELLDLSFALDVDIPISKKVYDEIIEPCEYKRKSAKNNLALIYPDEEAKMEARLKLAVMTAITLDNEARKKLDNIQKWMNTAIRVGEDDGYGQGNGSGNGRVDDMDRLMLRMHLGNGQNY